MHGFRGRYGEGMRRSLQMTDGHHVITYAAFFCYAIYRDVLRETAW